MRHAYTSRSALTRAPDISFRYPFITMDSTTTELQVKKHIQLLRILSLGSWVAVTVTVQLASLLPLFDTSPITLLPRKQSWLELYVTPLLRWDAFHFVQIARQGYVYEHEWAFLPGAPLLMRFGAYLFRSFDARTEGISLECFLLAGSFAACICDSTTILYHLTLHYFRAPSLALLVSLLSILPSSPVTLQLVGYGEPFFTWLSYKGEHLCQWVYSNSDIHLRHVELCPSPVVPRRWSIRSRGLFPLERNSTQRLHRLGSCH